MGFHKRYLSKEIILSNISIINILIKSDALIMDQWSSRFFDDLDVNERKLRKKISNDLKLQSGCPDSHPDYKKLKSLSESLISLKNDPDWLDIHFVKTKLQIQTDISESGIFEIQREKCIEAIIKYYDDKK